jgi:hypothetical protein
MLESCAGSFSVVGWRSVLWNPVPAQANPTSHSRPNERYSASKAVARFATTVGPQCLRQLAAQARRRAGPAELDVRATGSPGTTRSRMAPTS